MGICKNIINYRRLKLTLIIIISLFISNVFLALLAPTSTASNPSAPPLKSPIYNDYINDSTPLLEWYPSFDAENDSLRYEVEVDENTGDWSSLVAYNVTGFSDTSWEITPALTPGTYKWRVRADDGKALPNSTSLWSSVWYFTIDIKPPFNPQGSGDFTAYTGKPFTIYANFSDNTSSVSISTIYYKKHIEPSYKSQLMAESMLNHFYITNQMMGINTTDDDDDYIFHIIAVDEARNPFKYSKASGLDFQITVLDKTPPEVISGPGEINVTTDDDFSILIQCTDNIELSSAILYIQKLGFQWQNIILDRYPLQGRFIINYSDLKLGLGLNTSDGINYEYYILVYDISNNILNYSKSTGVPWVINVTDNDNPKAISGSGDLNITTDDPFTIYANFTDNIRVINSILYIRELKDSDSNWFSTSMEEVTQNKFYIDYEDLKLHPQLQMDTTTGNNYEYYILAYDFEYNFYNYTKTHDKCWEITVIDNDSPVFINGSGDFEVTTDDPFTIYANFTDNIDVSNAVIFIRKAYGLNGGAQEVIIEGWKHIWMLKKTTKDYVEFSVTYDLLKTELELDTTNGIRLDYYLVAKDPVGNEVEYIKSLNEYWEIRIIDNDPPIFLSGSGNFSVNFNENFTIYADFYDNIAVKSASILYQFVETLNDPPSGSWAEFKMLSSSGGIDDNQNDFDLEHLHFTATNQDLKFDNNYFGIRYFIIASDENSNDVSYGTLTSSLSVEIQDNVPPKIESWTFEPYDLKADYDEDFDIKIEIIDIAGSGLDEQSVMIRYKRGSYDSFYHDYTKLEAVLSYRGSTRVSAWESESNAKTKWQFAIPRPLVDNDIKLSNNIRFSWEIIAGEYVTYEVQCKDLNGNTYESGVLSEYVDPVSINHFPIVNIVSPIGDDNLTGNKYIYWIATDPDDDELQIAIEISDDNGAHWIELASELTNTGTYYWDTTKYQNGNEYLVRIIVRDNELSVQDVSDDSFTIYNIASKKPDDKVKDDEHESEALSRIMFISVGISILVIISSFGFISGTEIGKFKFLSLIFVPLYSKLHHDDVLDHFTRGQIFGFIKAKPGEHYNTIKEALNLTNGTLSHHLRILEKEEFIYSQRDGFSARFYPREMKISLKDNLKLKKFQESIYQKVKELPGISQHELVVQLGASQQVVSYNLTKLVRDEILRIVKRGRENTYYINTPQASPPGPTYPTQTQPIMMQVQQPQQVTVPMQMTATAQSPYPPQPPQTMVSNPQLEHPTQELLPPMRTQQINTPNSKNISQVQE